jgi:hypothetical protein
MDKEIMMKSYLEGRCCPVCGAPEGDQSAEFDDKTIEVYFNSENGEWFCTDCFLK